MGKHSNLPNTILSVKKNYLIYILLAIQIANTLILLLKK